MLAMKTMIQGGYIVAFDGKGHKIIRDGVVVFQDDKIIHVGKSYEGQADETIDARGKLVSPGFINIHTGADLSTAVYRWDGFRDGLNVSKAYVVDGVGNLDLVGEDFVISALVPVALALKGGATTIVPIGTMATARWESPPEQAEVVAKTAGELGARAYVSHQYRSGVKYWDSDGAIRYHWNEEAGRAGLERGLRFAERLQGAYNDRIRTMLFPYQFDTCSAELLHQTKEAAQERGLIIHMHTAQSLFEFHESLRRYGKTPIQYLYDTGFLDPKVIVTHVVYTTSNPACGYPKGDMHDIECLARSGATVAHCATVFSLSGMLLRSFGRYRRAGVNIAIACEVKPYDMVKAMRYACILGKVAERDALAVTARDVFNAATLAGAKALGREDLGRLAPGAKADIVIVDLAGMHLGLIDDPIKTLVYMASMRDIERVIVDGRTVVEGGRVPGVDEEKLTRRAREINKSQTLAFVRQNPTGRPAEGFFPPSFSTEA
jgi:cytosine/adenosine deaminase-related metal-dependent hydrolase